MASYDLYDSVSLWICVIIMARDGSPTVSRKSAKWARQMLLEQHGVKVTFPKRIKESEGDE